MEEMGNLFMETSEDVLVLDTRDIVHTRVTDTIRGKMMLQTVQRLDIMWDVYVQNSLKSNERNQRKGC